MLEVTCALQKPFSSCWIVAAIQLLHTCIYMLTVFTLKGRVLSHLWWFCDVVSRPIGRSMSSIHLRLLANLLVVRFAFNMCSSTAGHPTAFRTAGHPTAFWTGSILTVLMVQVSHVHCTSALLHCQCQSHVGYMRVLCHALMSTAFKTPNFFLVQWSDMSCLWSSYCSDQAVKS